MKIIIYICRAFINWIHRPLCYNAKLIGIWGKKLIAKIPFIIQTTQLSKLIVYLQHGLHKQDSTILRLIFAISQTTTADV